jgi:hypothetical protein
MIAILDGYVKRLYLLWEMGRIAANKKVFITAIKARGAIRERRLREEQNFDLRCECCGNSFYEDD